MAWHLHTFKRKLILATLIRRHVYASVEFGCLARNGYTNSYQCNCLHHKYQAATAFLLHPSNNQLHTGNQSKNHGVPRPCGKASYAQWLWECQQIANQCTKEEHRHESKELKTESSPSSTDFQPSENFQHSRRSRSIHWDRRETKLMCINDKHGIFVRHDDVFDAAENSRGSCSSETSSECAEETKDMDPPLVFLLDSKGKQEVLDLLAEHKQSSDQSALDKLNRLVDIIQQRENIGHYFNQDSKNIAKEKITRHNTSSFEMYSTAKSSTYEEYLRAVNNRRLPFDGRHHGTNIVSMRACRQGKLQGTLVVNNHVSLCSGNGSTSVPSSNRGRGEPSKEQLAVMYQRLYEQIPNFYSQSHDYTMYANDVVFDNRILNVKTTGLPAYKATVQSLKYLSTACLYNVNLEVLNLTINTEMNCIQARWRVIGVPLHRLILLPWRKGAKKYFDAFSTFDVGSDGLIHTHVVDKVMPNPGDKVTAPSLATRIGIALGIVRPQAPAVQGNCTGNMNLSFVKPKWWYSKQQNI
ncbi:uncharacterized protein [Amphiura filiformis]|uniref:uncharacterized protein n=1 Tax=Amphiura filiformis TaxID=82378 RepID=UPI003B214D00